MLEYEIMMAWTMMTIVMVQKSVGIVMMMINCRLNKDLKIRHNKIGTI